MWGSPATSITSDLPTSPWRRKYLLHLPLKAAYLIDDMARDTAALLDALGIPRAHVVGASMGGMMPESGGECAGESGEPHIDHVHDRQAQPPAAHIESAARVAARARETRRRGGRDPAVDERAARHRQPDPSAEEGYLRDLCERHVRRSYDPAGVARQLIAVAASGDRTAVVRRIKVPTLVLHGDEDPLVRPACGEETARVIRDAGGDAKLEIIRGMGHDLPVPLLPQLAERIVEHCLRHRTQ